MTEDEKTTTPPRKETPAPEQTEAPADSEVAEPTGESPQDEGELKLQPPEPAAPIDEEVLISRLESLVFVAPTPITVRRLARILSIDGKQVRHLLGVIRDHYQNRGIVLEEVSGGFQFRSHPDNAAVIRHVFKLKPLRISRAAMETLAIVAYRQPLTRAEVEAIRGVDCGGTLKYLFEKGLVRIIGRKEEPGRPIIYATSKDFLELFSLKSLSDLPALHEFHELWDEHQELVDEQTPEEESPDAADQWQEQQELPVEPASEEDSANPADQPEEPRQRAGEPEDVPVEASNQGEAKENDAPLGDSGGDGNEQKND